MNEQAKTHQVGPDQTRMQAVLTRAGRARLGIGRERETGGSAADEDYTAVEVRRAGAGRLARWAGAMAAAAAIFVGVTEGPNLVASGDGSAGPNVVDTRSHNAYEQIQANQADQTPIQDQPTPGEAQARAAHTQFETPQS